MHLPCLGRGPRNSLLSWSAQYACESSLRVILKPISCSRNPKNSFRVELIDQVSDRLGRMHPARHYLSVEFPVGGEPLPEELKDSLMRTGSPGSNGRSACCPFWPGMGLQRFSAGFAAKPYIYLPSAQPTCYGPSAVPRTTLFGYSCKLGREPPATAGVGQALSGSAAVCRDDNDHFSAIHRRQRRSRRITFIQCEMEDGPDGAVLSMSLPVLLHSAPYEVGSRR